MYIREVVKSELCEVNGRNENVGYRLRKGDFLEIDIDLGRETAMMPQAIELDIYYDDNDLIVVNKPAGMLVHPTHRDKNGTLLNALSHHLNIGNGLEVCLIRPGLIHRLDKQTSGLIVIAKNSRAHRIMAKQFHKKQVEKRYLALVNGEVELTEGIIESPIGRYAELKQWNVKSDGKPSTTRFWVRRRWLGKTLLELEPVTGRTNQLRIHLASIGHPLIGDVLRGGGDHRRLCLHAYRLCFLHPTSGERIVLESSVTFEKND